MNEFSNKAIDLRQIFQFGSVGACAASAHMGIVIAIVQMAHISPLLANIIAFLFSFNISYFGHHYWTFAKRQLNHQTSLPRFFLLACFSFLLNEGLFFLLLPFLPYPIALLVVLVSVAAITFFLSKWWAFR